jgi:HEAT repeat protein
MNDSKPAHSSFFVLLRAAATLAAALAIPMSVGCSLWPVNRDKTSIITPSMRMASIREFGPKARDADAAEQNRICQQLAQQIQTEPDPIVRRTIQETIGEFDTPLANAVILAGLNDDDRDVRVTCCRLLAKRNNPAAVGPLSQIVATDTDLDVRLAAVDALGEMKTPGALQGLAAALKDRDPALQFAGVEGMKKVSGEDLGNDVEAWRQYAARTMGAAQPNSAIAAQPATTTVK